MLNTADILETINMIRQENLDIRTITMGISLFDCVSEDENRLCEKIYDKITKKAEHLVKTGENIEKEYGVPITSVGIYTTNTANKAAEAMRAKVEEIAFRHLHVKEVHGFYVDEKAKAMQFDVVLSFEAEDREVLWRHIIEDVQKEFPDYTIQVILDSDITD